MRLKIPCIGDDPIIMFIDASITPYVDHGSFRRKAGKIWVQTGDYFINDSTGVTIKIEVEKKTN